MHLKFLHLEYDHGFVDALEQGVGEAWATIAEATFDDIEQQELDQGPSGEAVEKFLLVKTTTVEVALQKGSTQAEGFLAGAVLEDLLSFEAAVGVVTGEPVAEPLGEGVMIERVLEITHSTIHHGDGIHQALVVDKLRAEEADIKGRRLHILELATLEEVAPADAVGSKFGIGVAGDRMELSRCFWSEPFISINIENPRVAKLYVA